MSTTTTPLAICMTQKQIQIMKLVVAGNGLNEKGELIPVDLNELLERLPYKTSKDSMHFSIRALMRRGMLFKAGLERRRNRMHLVLLPTKLGIASVATKAVETVVEPTGVPSIDINELCLPRISL